MTKDSEWRKKQAEELRDEFIDFKEAVSGEKHEGWRKRQINSVLNNERNSTLEEVALEFDKMKMFGDTAASFAAFVRNMKT